MFNEIHFHSTSKTLHCKYLHHHVTPCELAKFIFLENLEYNTQLVADMYMYSPNFGFHTTLPRQKNKEKQNKYDKNKQTT